MQKKLIFYFRNLRGEIFSQELISKFKMKEQDFTRNRKQSFCGTLLIMFNLLKKSLAVEIDGFVRHLSGRLSTHTPYFTTSAFTQNRKKINPEVFKHLSGVIIDNFYTDENDELKLFKGFRMLAADCSTLTLPYTEELKGRYGVAKNTQQLDVVQAKISVLYDVLNGLALDITLDKPNHAERELALRHTHCWKSNDLIIYDRGYPSFDFIYEHIDRKVNCLIRAKTTHSYVIKDFVAGGKKSLVTLIYPERDGPFKGKGYNRKSSLKVRLVRVDLPGGETEILITTLLDSQKHPTRMFKELYFMRWGIETFYDELKNKLKVEYFSGYSDTTIRQDLFCTIFISNLQSVIVNSLKSEIEIQNKGRKYQYKVNTNLSYGFLKNRMLDLLYQEIPVENVLKELEGLFLKNIIPIRNNRTNPRDTQKYRYKTKPITTKNQKDSI